MRRKSVTGVHIYGLFLVLGNIAFTVLAFTFDPVIGIIVALALFFLGVCLAEVKS